MSYAYSLATVIPASAREIYDAWLDSLAHSKMTGGRAKISAELGAEFSAWDGYITGRNLELTPGERIVQSWRTTKFPADHEDSIITVTFGEHDDGTLLTLSHSNVPEGQLGYEQGGWQESYFEPMVAYFSGERSVGARAEEKPQPAGRARLKRRAAKMKAVPPKAGPKRATARKKSTTRKKTAAPKARRKSTAAKVKPKVAASKAKMAVAKTRAKRKVRAKTRGKRIGSARRKSAGGGRH